MDSSWILGKLSMLSHKTEGDDGMWEGMTWILTLLRKHLLRKQMVVNLFRDSETRWHRGRK